MTDPLKAAINAGRRAAEQNMSAAIGPVPPANPVFSDGQISAQPVTPSPTLEQLLGKRS